MKTGDETSPAGNCSSVLIAGRSACLPARAVYRCHRAVAFEAIFPLVAPRSGSARLAANHDCSAGKQLFWRRRRNRSFKLIVDGEWPADGRSDGPIDDHLMDIEVYGDHYVTSSGRPVPQSPRRLHHPLSPPAQIMQSFYLTEYNFTNWFVLAISARSVYGDLCGLTSLIVSTTDRWWSACDVRTLHPCHPLQQ